MDGSRDGRGDGRDKYSDRTEQTTRVPRLGGGRALYEQMWGEEHG